MVYVGAYADYISMWFGLRDGTMLDRRDPAGKMWVKVGDELMTVEEWNRRQDEDD